MKYCPKCENKLIEGLRYCFKCGADVDTNNVKKNTEKDVNKNVNESKANKVRTRMSVEVIDVFFN